MPLPIIFGAINVNTASTNSAVTVGMNAEGNWSSHTKNNFGDGMLFGVFASTGMYNLILDNDMLDTPISDPDTSVSRQNQQL